MKSAEPSIGRLKRLRGEASTTTPTSSTMSTVEETFVDLTTTVDLFGGVDDIDPTVPPPLSLLAMM